MSGQRDTREKEPLNPIIGLFDDSPIQGPRQEGLGLLIDRDAHKEGVLDPRDECGKGRYTPAVDTG